MRLRVRRRMLPHWDVPGGTYFVTACLYDSLPAQGVLDIRNLEHRLQRQVRPPGVSQEDWEQQKWKIVFARRDEWMDVHPAVRHLEDERLASVVQQSLYHFAGERYDLLAYVIMPSHFHWLFRPKDEWVASLGEAVNTRSPRERIMHSVLSFSSRTCNRLLDESGPFWQSESYDHVVRDEDELSRIIDYIELNPVRRDWVKQREAWRFSSACDRYGLPPSRLARPLTKECLRQERGDAGIY